MSHPAQAVANWFINAVDRAAGEAITPLKLQKLLYYAQAWSLVFNDRPLINEEFEAWAHGPVLRSIFQEYRHLKWEAIPPADSDEDTEFDEEELNVLHLVQDAYGEVPPKQLEAMTHGEAPWRDARGNLAPEARSSNVISQDAMRSYYSDLYDRLTDEPSEE